jgi:hypothetical protein
MIMLDVSVPKAKAVQALEAMAQALRGSIAL